MSTVLMQRSRQALAAVAGQVEPRVLLFTLDFSRLVLRLTRRSKLNAAQERILVQALETRTGMDGEAIGTLLGLAAEDELHAPLTEGELLVLLAHYGSAAAEALAAEQSDDLDLEVFRRRYGVTGALLLLDTLFAICSVDATPDAEKLARLEAAGVGLELDPLLVTTLLQKHSLHNADGELRIPLVGKRISIGRVPTCDVHLPDPQVDPHHADLVCVDGDWRVVAAGTRPTVLNGSAVSSAPLVRGDRLRIGPYLLEVVAGELRGAMQRRLSVLSVRGLKRRLGATVLLDDISFTCFSGEVIALVGPSGSGKTSLLNAISGIVPADQGAVLLDGADFHGRLKRDPVLVASVPQDDIVQPELTVEESLRYAARLRLPPATTLARITANVNRVLADLNLEDVRHSRIGDALARGISGGQRKRVNLGQELLTDATRILFLDEPTSGLDPLATLDIARLARQVADQARIVFLVTHDLSPQVLAQVDHLLILTRGGRLAYFGPPLEACEYFQVPTPEAIFERLGERTPEAWSQAFRESVDARRYVATREHVLGQPASAERPERPPQCRSVWRDLGTLVGRYARVKARDLTDLAVLLAQPVLLAAVMVAVFTRTTTALLFMLALSVFWFGLSASVRELIADRILWRREHRLGVGVLPYLGSKVLVLGAALAAQCIFLVGVLFLTTDLSQMGFSWPLLTGICMLVGWTGMALGLLVSASWSSAAAAVGTLVILLVPQIAFSGILMPISHMPRVARWLSWLSVERYALDAVLRCGREINYLSLNIWYQRSVDGDLYLLGLRQAGLATGIPLAGLCGILVGIGLLCLAFTARLAGREGTARALVE